VFSRKMSAGSARSKMPRRLTQGPRLVETVTSGEVVTMRSASAVSLAAMSPKILPKASWSTAGRLGGPAGSTARYRRGFVPAPVGAASGTPSRNSPSRCAGMPRPANGSHSAPSGTAMPRRNEAIWSRFYQPRVVVLVPGKGSP